jgi:hypothetical protein
MCSFDVCSARIHQSTRTDDEHSINSRTIVGSVVDLIVDGIHGGQWYGLREPNNARADDPVTVSR